MAVLKLTQTRAPDFSGTSKILAQAGLSMDRGFEAAQGLLSSYQEGAQDKVDNEVFAETAGMNREQLQAFFDKNGLKGRNLSQSARERLAGQFGTIADVNRTRGLIDATADQTIRLNATRAEKAAEEVDRLAARSFARQNAAGGALAFQEGFREGLDGPGSAPVRPGAPVVRPGVPPTPADRIAAAAPTPPVASAPVASVTDTAPGRSTPVSATESGFMSQVGAGFTGADGTVYEGIKNPNALAVIAAYGQHESEFDPKNVNRTWNDGKNDAGGTMSWNGKRLKAMQDFVGGDKSPEAQARFLLQEDPKLMKRLEASTSIEEANDIMAKAWRFKGYKNTEEGSEYANRLATAKTLFNATPATAAVATAPTAADGGPIDSQPLDPIAVAAAGKPPIWATGPLTGSTEEQANEAARRIRAEIALTDPDNRFDGNDPAATGPNKGGRPVVPLEVLQREVDRLGQEGTPAAVTLEEAVRPPEVTEMIEDPRKFRKAREQSIMANPYLTGDQMIKKLDAMNDVTNRGEAENLRVEAAARQERLIAAATKWADDPNSSMKLEDLQKLLSDMPGTAMEKAAAGLYALEVGTGALAYKIKPSYIADPSVKRGVDTELARNRKTLEIQPIHQIANLAKLFGDDDPSSVMEDYVKSKGDGEAQTPYWFGIGADATEANSVRKLVAFIAFEAGVTPAIAAAAMSVRFTPDPDGFFDSFNTNENRFDKTGTIAWLKANANEESLRVYQGDVERVARREDELNAGGLELAVKQHRYKKLNDTNSTPQERKDAKQAITSLQNTLKAGRTPLDGAMELSKYIGIDGMGIQTYLKTLEPGSELYNNTVGFIKLTVEGDTSISPAHKRLLLAAINS